MVKICPKCNKMNKDENKFCEGCGTTLPVSEPVKEKKSSSGGVMDIWNKQSSGGKAAIGIAGICCLGLILIIGFFAFSTPDTSDTTTTTTTTTDKFSSLSNPSDVKNTLAKYDYNNDDRIEFLDKYSDNPDGQEEFATWAVSAGFDSSDATTLTNMFNKYNTNGDNYWNIYELDDFYDDT